MASQLYNVLNDINAGRENCVRALQSKGQKISESASFNSIASHINALSVDKENINTVFEGCDEFTSVEDDVEIYKFPQDWPDFKSIFKAETDIEAYGHSYYPSYMLVFSTDLDTTEFYQQNQSNEMDFAKKCLDPNNIELGKVRLGYVDGGTSASTSYNRSLYLKFSDDSTGVINELADNSNRTYIHTWDTTKDIILQDGTKLKYVIVFIQFDKSSAISYSGKYINCTGVTLHEAYSVERCLNNNSVSTSSSSSAYLGYSSGFNSGIVGGNEYKRLTIISPFTTGAKSKISSDSGTNSYPYHLGLFNTVQQLYIEYDDENEDNSKQPMIKITPGCINTRCNVFVTNSKKVIGASYPGSSTTYNWFQNTLYMRVPYLKRLQGCYQLRYLEITDPEAQQQIEFIWDNNISPNLTVQNLYNNLVHITAGSNQSSNTDIGFGRNLKSLSFDLLENTVQYMFAGMCCKKISLPKIKDIPHHVFLYSLIEELYMPALETVSFLDSNPNTSIFPDTLRILVVPKLTDLSKVKFSSSKWSDWNLLYLDASSAVMGYMTFLYYIPTVKIGKGYKYKTIYMNTPYQSKRQILYFFDQLADVTNETTTYTIRIQTQYLGRFTDEELDIVRNKGWKITN